MNKQGTFVLITLLITLVLLLIVQIFSNVAHAEEPYCVESVEQSTECAVYVITAVDYLQTRQIQYKDNLRETNDYICGKQPGEFCTMVWMLSKAGLMYYLNHSNFGEVEIAGLKLRTVFNVLYTTSHMRAVHVNNKLGLSVGLEMRW